MSAVALMVLEQIDEKKEIVHFVNDHGDLGNIGAEGKGFRESIGEKVAVGESIKIVERADENRSGGMDFVGEPGESRPPEGRDLRIHERSVGEVDPVAREPFPFAQCADPSFLRASHREQGGGGMGGHCCIRRRRHGDEIVETVFEHVARYCGFRNKIKQILRSGDRGDDARG